MAQNQRPVTGTPTKAYGNSPKSLKPQVPVDDLDAELEAVSAMAQTQGSLDEELASLDSGAAAAADESAGLLGSIQQTNNVIDQAKGIAGQGLKAVGEVLDYPGGFLRTAGADAIGAMTGNPNAVTATDYKKAAIAEAPMAEEYLRRLGVPEGGKLGPTNTRGVAGFALDVLADPLTLLTKVTKQIPYLGKILNGTGLGTEALGEAVYKSAVKGIDDKIAKKGAGSVGDLLVESGAPILTSQEKVAKKVNEMSNLMGKVRGGLYEKANQLGATVDMDNLDVFKNARAVIEKMRKNPGLRGSADELEGLVSSYYGSGKVPIELVSEWKTSLYNALPANSFGPNGKLRGEAKMFKAALASDFKNAIVSSGNKAEKGLGNAIDQLNEKWGTLLEAQNAAAKGGSSGTLGNMIDGAVAATGGVKGYAYKKAFDLATGTAARTTIGKALQQAGRKGIAQGVANRALINASGANTPVVTEEEE